MYNAWLEDKLTRGRWFISGHMLCPFMPAHSSDVVLLLVHAGLLIALDYTKGPNHLKHPPKCDSVLNVIFICYWRLAVVSLMLTFASHNWYVSEHWPISQNPRQTVAVKKMCCAKWVGAPLKYLLEQDGPQSVGRDWPSVASTAEWRPANTLHYRVSVHL